MAVYPATLAPPPYLYPYTMDREKGIKAYQAMVSAEEHKKRVAIGDKSVLHRYENIEENPVISAVVTVAEETAKGIMKYEFQSISGDPLPEWHAGAHLDIVIAPEFLRQYSMSGDPADRSKYQIVVLREDYGRGGSKLMHRVFSKGRHVFFSQPINHFALNHNATKTLLMGGGIGITPLIAMAHELYARKAAFELHYSGRKRETMGLLEDISSFPWSDHVTLHVSHEGTRADFHSIMSGYQSGWNVYACGAEAYMSAVMDAAQRAGFPEDARHLEYFSVPEIPDYKNSAFTIKLLKSKIELTVPANKNAAEVLIENGIPVNLKCSDGLCGVCKCGLVSGEVEHRDFVLSKAQQKNTIIVCQSRAANPDGLLELNL